MRVAIVSQFYPPEVGATQNRVGTFATGLRARGHQVVVICEQPNHPSGVFQPGFGRRPVMIERAENLEIHRLWVAASPRKTTSRRLAFYGTFAAGAALTVAGIGPLDVVFSSSPPLPAPLTVAVVARLRGIPLVLDVRDPWPAAAQALGELSSRRIIQAFELGERWIYRASEAVTTTTRPFCEHIDRVAGTAKSVLVPNGALDSLLEAPDVPPPAEGPFVVGYVGNFGIAQGLRIVLDAAELMREETVRFVLVGAGPMYEELKRERDRRDLPAVSFRPTIPVTELAGCMQQFHALLVPLGAEPMLADFVPSKLYDAMAIGRPAIVAARGEAASLIEESGAGVTVPPEDGTALAAAVRELAGDRGRARAMGLAGRSAAAEHVRSRQVDRVEQILLAAAEGRHSR